MSGSKGSSDGQHPNPTIAITKVINSEQLKDNKPEPTAPDNPAPESTSKKLAPTPAQQQVNSAVAPPDPTINTAVSGAEDKPKEEGGVRTKAQNKKVPSTLWQEVSFELLKAFEAIGKALSQIGYVLPDLGKKTKMLLGALVVPIAGIGAAIYWGLGKMKPKLKTNVKTLDQQKPMTDKEMERLKVNTEIPTTANLNKTDNVSSNPILADQAQQLKSVSMEYGKLSDNFTDLTKISEPVRFSPSNPSTAANQYKVPETPRVNPTASPSKLK